MQNLNDFNYVINIYAHAYKIPVCIVQTLSHWLKFSGL